MPETDTVKTKRCAFLVKHFGFLLVHLVHPCSRSQNSPHKTYFVNLCDLQTRTLSIMVLEIHHLERNPSLSNSPSSDVSLLLSCCICLTVLAENQWKAMVPPTLELSHLLLSQWLARNWTNTSTSCQPLCQPENIWEPKKVDPLSQPKHLSDLTTLAQAYLFQKHGHKVTAPEPRNRAVSWFFPWKIDEKQQICTNFD